jgi:hypothetical protein
MPHVRPIGARNHNDVRYVEAVRVLGTERVKED